jgi:hypothetical protein
MRSWRWLLLLGVLGCRNTDVLEAQLRQQSRQLRELRSELLRQQAVNHAYELTRPAGPGKSEPSISPVNPFGIKDLTLARGTGGLDRDRLPGDEGLLVILVPRDHEEHPLKAVGSVSITALALSPEGVKVPVCSWELSAVQLRACWQVGLFSTGYQLELPWKQVPHYEKVRVIAQLRTPDERLFEAEKEVIVRLPPKVAPSVELGHALPGSPVMIPELTMPTPVPGHGP